MAKPILTDNAKKFLGCMRVALGLPASVVPWDGAMHKALMDREADAPGVAAMFGVSNDAVNKIRYGDFPLTVPAVAISAPLTDPTWMTSFWDCFGMTQPSQEFREDTAKAMLSEGEYSVAAKSAAEVIYYIETRTTKPEGSPILSFLTFALALGGAVWLGK